MQGIVPTRLCTYCQVEKPWVFSGKKLRDGSKIYTNEFALRWAGRRCPDCERMRVKAAVKCDSFERDIIIKQLKQAGYKVNSKVLPIEAEKNGQVYSVGIRHAHAHDGNIILNKASSSDKADIYALVFSSVRICSSEQLENLEGKVDIYPVSKKNTDPRKKDLGSTNVTN